jgi:hypothetical protein
MWWKLGALALLAVGLLVALLAAPVTTVDVTVEMPVSQGPPRDSDGEGILTLIMMTPYALMAAAFALIGWLMWRVVRHHRACKERS